MTFIAEFVLAIAIGPVAPAVADAPVVEDSPALVDSDLTCHLDTDSYFGATDLMPVVDSGHELGEMTSPLAEEESAEIIGCFMDYAVCAASCTFLPELCIQICAYAQDLCNLECAAGAMPC